MAISMYGASTPIFLRMLDNLDHWLQKAEAHATAKGFDPVIYLNTRLAPDMLPFQNQIWIGCDAAKFAVARLAGIDAPKFDDSAKNLADLRERIRQTAEFIRSVPADQLDGTDDKEVTIPRRTGTMTMKGEAYLKNFVLPNFFFHMTTAYALLRHNGVELGKMDFLGALQ